MLIMAASAAALAACSAEPANDAENTAVDVAAPDDVTTAMPDTTAAEPAHKVPAPPPAKDEPDEAAPGPSAEATIPSPLQGRWGLTPADCTSTRGDAKGLLIISGNELRFYESRGTLGNVAERDDSRIVADFSFMGEGQTWQRRMVLDGQDSGKTLVRREYGEGAMPGAFKYQRCETE
jgi:hypothetical protein